MTQAALRLRSGGADHEARLARAAAGGNGRAFATLYCRYEQLVFNLAFRVTGSRDHAAQATREAFLDALLALPHREGGESAFGSCLLTATRNAGYELLEPRPGASTVPDPPAEAGPLEQADRDLVFQAEQHRIREAGWRLTAPEREVLALGSLGDLSYGEIAAIMDIERGSVPALIAGARISLHDELSGSSLASATSASEECDQALPLIAMRDDGKLDEEEAQWVLDHLAHCGRCRLRLDAMQGAATAYDGWEPAAAPPALFQETMAAAAQSSSTNWSEATSESGAERSAATETLASLRGAASGLASRAWRHRPRRNPVVTAGLLCLMLVGLAGVAAGATLILHGSGRAEPTVPSGAAVDSPIEEVPAAVQRAEPRPRTGLTAKTEKTPAPQSVPTAPQSVVVVGAPPVPERPESTPKNPSPRAKAPRRRTPQAEAVPIPKPSPPASQPAPTSPPAGTAPQQPQPAGCKDPAGNPVPCPG